MGTVGVSVIRFTRPGWLDRDPDPGFHKQKEKEKQKSFFIYNLFRIPFGVATPLYVAYTLCMYSSGCVVWLYSGTTV